MRQRLQETLWVGAENLELDWEEGQEEQTSFSKRARGPAEQRLRGRGSRHEGAAVWASEQWTLQWLGYKEERGAL